MEVDRQKITAVIQENLAVINAENIKRMLKTLDPSCENYQSTIKMMTQVFNECDLKVTMTQSNLTEVSSTQAKVRCITETK